MPDLVYVFRTDCPACARQQPEWKSVASEAATRGWHVAALTNEAWTGAVLTYFQDAPIEILQPADPAVAASALAAPAVPTTIAIEADGRVAFHRVGVLPPAALDSLRAALRRPGP